MKVLDDDARSVSEVTGLKLQMSGSVDNASMKYSNGGEMLAITIACALALGAQRQVVARPDSRPSVT
jgi:hypothetical protein